MSTTPKKKQSMPSITPTESFDSVRVFWLNRQAILEQLQESIQALTDQHPEIERVVLFGSLARGDAVPGSDVDLLLIVRESTLPFLERSVQYQLPHVGVGVDFFVYTQAEFKNMLEAGNTFIAQALREGIALFNNRE